MDQDEIYEDSWDEKENKWLPSPKNDVLTTAFWYAKYSKGTDDLTEFGMRNSVT